MKKNKSRTYLLPLLSEVVEFNFDFHQNLKNTYINFVEHDNCIGLLYDFSFKNPEFTKYEATLVSNPYFKELVDVDDKVLYIFNFPEEYMHEYNMYKESKLSLFKTDAKKLILAFFAELYSGNNNLADFLFKIKRILYKDPKYRRQLEKELRTKIDKNQELGEKCNLISETFVLDEHI